MRFQTYSVVESVQLERRGCISVNLVLQRLTGPVVSISQLITVNSFSFDKLHAPFNSCKSKNTHLKHGTAGHGWSSSAQSLQVRVWLFYYEQEKDRTTTVFWKQLSTNSPSLRHLNKP